MIKDNIRSLIYCIVLVLLLLGLCVHSDYADTNPIIAKNTSLKMPKGTVVVNDSVNCEVITNHDGKVYTDKSVKVESKPKKKKKKLPTISMWAKPSVRSRYSYTWHKFTWIDYCPNCGHYNALLKNPKMVPENEYTCRYCDSDFCAVTGKEKYSWSNVYLRRV